MRNKKGIIFAADILQKFELKETIRQIADYIDAIKIGNWVLYQHGFGIVEEVKMLSDLPVIADLKLMDIPEIAERIAGSAVNAGIDGLIVSGAAGSETIDSCKKTMKGRMVFVFTEFTHCSGLIDKEMADDYVDIAVVLGCEGVQVPGTKAERIKEVRQRVGNDLLLISCGVGSQNHCSGKGQKTTFGSAIAAGADYEIIGRSIYMPSGQHTPRDVAMSAKNAVLKLWSANEG